MLVLLGTGRGVDLWTSANNHWCVVLKMRVGGGSREG